jgi:cold shock CspA family protein
MTERYTGIVKWFNNKTGYGFIQNINMTKEDDIFVHHQHLRVENQYKYLVQGEYVEYVKKTLEGKHKHVASDVSGIQGGPLMCETRHKAKESYES